MSDAEAGRRRRKKKAGKSASLPLRKKRVSEMLNPVGAMLIATP